MSIKNIIYFSLVFILNFSFKVNAQEFLLTAEEKAYIESLGIVKTVFVDGIAPLQYKNSKGEMKGISISIMKEVATILNFDVEYIVCKNLEEAYSKDYDIALSSTENYITDNIILTDPYLKSELVMYYNTRFQVKDLAGKKYAMVSGGSIPKDVDKENVVYFDNRKDILDAIESGKADYSYGNAFSFAFYELQNNYKNLSYIPLGEVGREYSFGIKKENTIFLAVLNKAIKEIDESRMNTLILENLSNIERNISALDFLERFFIEIFFIFIFVFIFILLINSRLKKDIEIIKEKEEKIRTLSYYDSLTGLYNRRFLEDQFKTAEKKENLPVSVIIGDVNGLKLINDNLGHGKGDELLISVANILKKSCREGDIISRFGGDEFVILIYNTSFGLAKTISNRIKENCKKVHIENIPLSISLGYATKEGLNKSIQEVFKEADKMMYECKLLEAKTVKNLILSSLENSLCKKTIETKV